MLKINAQKVSEIKNFQNKKSPRCSSKILDIKNYRFVVSNRKATGAELMISVLPLLTDRCCLVLVVKTNARLQSP